ncbi:unknown [Bacteroides uniformis CAG:3]|jgi:hypothetical protein|nr:unknown [Bacteroides uniformis CAG:3]
MTREEKIARLIRAGYKVERLGRNIKATNKKGSFRGSVNFVHLQIFGY